MPKQVTLDDFPQVARMFPTQPPGRRCGVPGCPDPDAGPLADATWLGVQGMACRVCLQLLKDWKAARRSAAYRDVRLKVRADRLRKRPRLCTLPGCPGRSSPRPLIDARRFGIPGWACHVCATTLYRWQAGGLPGDCGRGRPPRRELYELAMDSPVFRRREKSA